MELLYEISLGSWADATEPLNTTVCIEKGLKNLNVL